MIDNSKDIILSNNTLKNSNNNNKEIDLNININIDKENNNNSNISEENKMLNSNNDKELIKNIISSTVKKIKINTNTLTSEFSSNNNNSNSNNPSNKMDYVKMINFSSETNNKETNSNNNLANLDDLIQDNTEKTNNGTTPFNLYNNKKKYDKEIEIKHINKDNNTDTNIINASSSEYLNQTAKQIIVTVGIRIYLVKQHK